jgi:2'-5' RNA ligase
MTKRLTYIGFKALGMGFDAHLTVIYTGRMNPEKEDKVRQLLDKVPMRDHYCDVQRKRIALFGPTLTTPVVLVEVPGSLLTVRDKLIEAGVPNPSQYKWNPHITLDIKTPGTITIPSTIILSNFDLY